jgi:hypothetical protein
VLARNGALSYCVKRFLRRSRSLVISILAVSLALALGLCTTLVQKDKAERERAIALKQKDEADHQRALAVGEARRITQANLGIRQRLADSKLEVPQLRASIENVLDEEERKLKDTADQLRDTRGNGSDVHEPNGNVAVVLIARNYDLLGRLRAVTGDPAGARRARHSCVAILERAQRAGDGSAETADLLNRCQAELK